MVPAAGHKPYMGLKLKTPHVITSQMLFGHSGVAHTPTNSVSGRIIVPILSGITAAVFTVRSFRRNYAEVLS
jgi:hypothetical protein